MTLVRIATSQAGGKKIAKAAGGGWMPEFRLELGRRIEMGYGARSQLLGRVNPRSWGPFVRRRMQGIEDASKPTARRAGERAYRVRTAVAARRINSS
ncbi:MAG: hypothetical protein ACK53V_23925, partial [Planctomycetota bacterium]